MAALSVLAALVVGLWITLAQPTFRRNRPSTAAVASDRLRDHVLKLSNEFHPRDFTEHANLERSADYIEKELLSAGATTASQEFTAGGQTFRNISGRFGRDTGPVVVVGAHYDSHDGTPGADDNASGVAGLIELARLLGGSALQESVELVAYCLEEPPFFRSTSMGSYHHARELSGRKVRVTAVIALEMIGCFKDKRGSQDFPAPILRLFYPSRGNFVAVIGDITRRETIKQVKIGMKAATDLPVYSMSAPSRVPGVDFSDHRSYWQFGLPAVMVTDTAFYRNDHYHAPGDTADTLDYERMAKVVVAVFEAVLRLDAAGPPPTQGAPRTGGNPRTKAE